MDVLLVSPMFNVFICCACEDKCCMILLQVERQIKPETLKTVSQFVLASPVTILLVTLQSKWIKKAFVNCEKKILYQIFHGCNCFSPVISHQCGLGWSGLMATSFL